MQTTLRKNITLSNEDYTTISNYARKQGISFSEFLRSTALNAIKQFEDIELLNFMVANCKPVDAIEQAEIDNMNIDFDDIDGKELSLDEVLQG